jgi:hypothetical protein
VHMVGGGQGRSAHGQKGSEGVGEASERLWNHHRGCQRHWELGQVRMAHDIDLDSDFIILKKRQQRDMIELFDADQWMALRVYHISRCRASSWFMTGPLKTIDPDTHQIFS